MLNRVGDRRQPWRTPTEVWSHSPIFPWARTAPLALLCSCWIICISFCPMLYLFIVAQKASCLFVKCLFVINEHVEDVLLVLTVLLTQNSKVENLFCCAPSSSKPSLYFGNDLLCLGCQSVQYDFRHHFACVADEANRSIILT